MKTLFLSGLVAGACLLFAAEPAIVGGPWVVNVTTRTATIAWLVGGGSVTVKSPATSFLRVSPALHTESTTLTGLQPNTRYEYDVPGTQGLTASFTTAPVAGGSFHFVVYGDNRTRDDVHRKVVAAVLKSGVPDFIVQTGDMVPDGFDSSYWPVFFDIERDLLRQTVFFPALGNHERGCRYFYDFFQLSNSYYSFNWGSAHFIVLNSDLVGAAPSARERDAFWAGQLRWLEDDLQANQKAEFRFVSAHHPPFTAVASRQGNNPHMTALAPMFEKYRVDAAFFGHDHNYQRYLKNGVQYITTGGGGAPLYDVKMPDPAIVQKVVSIENFVTASVEGKTARFTALDIDGNKLDELEIRHSTPPASNQRPGANVPPRH